MNPRNRKDRRGIAWLEILLLLAVISLLMQLWPAFGNRILAPLDVRNWSRAVWFVGNLAVVLFLLGIRFGPDLIKEWRERREKNFLEHEKAVKADEIKQHKQALKRIKASRRRRMY